jgi:hypothetical protein
VLRPFVTQKRHNRKRQDALEMLQALQQPPQGPFHATFQMQETSLLRDWKLEEQGTFVHDQWISDREILVAYQLFGEDYPQVHRRCLGEQLAQMACASSARKTGPLSPSSQNLAQSVARYFATTYAFPLDGDLPEDARRWLYPHEQSLSRPEQLVLLGVRLWHMSRSQSWQATMIQELKAAELYHSLAKLVYQSRRFLVRLQESNHNVQLARLLPGKVREWAMQRWHCSEATFEIALLDHGFKSSDVFFRLAGVFYLFDKYRGVSLPLLAGRQDNTALLEADDRPVTDPVTLS